MTQSPDTMERAVRAITRLRAELEQAKRDQLEEIAVIGIGCRLPGGVSSLDSLYELLAAGTDAVGEIPRERWNARALFAKELATAGKLYSTAGAFIEAIDAFDPEFFGITPREAVSIDPHQRILLELTWEALENAGIAPLRLRGEAVGVFVGMMGSEYGKRAISNHDYAHVDRYYATGNDPSFASGRISYVFGLRGPCLTLNTACSSSLAAVHLAGQSLRLRECELALASGVSLVLSPELNVFLSQLGALSPAGRCKTFDDSADGFVRGEGAAVLVLKRVSDALRDGDPIHCVLRGSALNHDGQSAGLTVPSGSAQRDVILKALRAARTEPSELSYIEAHGTGTALGDPIELQALADVFRGTRAPDDKVLVGSLKTHIGHLDAAAGVASVVKTCALFAHDLIPPPLHQRQLTSKIDWQQLALRVNRQPEPWPKSERVAGVSAFGMSGTNTHVILAQHPRTQSNNQQLDGV